MIGDMDRDGFAVFPEDPDVARWVQAAYRAGLTAIGDPDLQAKWLRHGGTWFVGVDALPTKGDGSIHGAPLAGAWRGAVPQVTQWHRAQLSVTYAGYPRKDEVDTEASHRFRLRRCSGHVDGLHAENGRRIVRELHAFILGMPLNDTEACPLMVWPGSHHVIGAALRTVIGDRDPCGIDVTDAYVAARRAVFDTITPVPVIASPGQVMVLHRHLVHGIAPHDPQVTMPDDGRMVAYFRPECSQSHDWV
ncbi:hypothetical protein [Pseudooctadecabacter sp.]|uniref:hypothetical protein n=1 Tax=Pseudooctadecabacter sp. TaxID=1966338 RepID=UPI0035C793EB